ncbi:MAG: DUF899 family protein, partial [bacterium]
YVGKDFSVNDGGNAQVQIEALEREIMEKKQELARLRKTAEPETIADYKLETLVGSRKLSDFFAGKRDLILIHNMGKGCRYCTLWADGFNGLHQHLQNRTGLVLVSPDDPQVQQEFAASRGWKFPIASGHGSSFAADLGFAQDGKYWPGVSVLRRQDNGSIVRVAKSFFGPGDNYCSLWDLFDLLPDGPAGWEPQYSYE